jgi:NitT/TauT family transport system substrate-binding protein
VSNPASDETLFAGMEWIKSHEAQADIIVAEFYKLWNEMSGNPGIIEQERVKYNLMMDQPKEVLVGVTDFYKVSVKEGIYSPIGCGVDVAKSDFEFYTEAGQMQGSAASLKVEDFWYLSPLDKARKAAGK